MKWLALFLFALLVAPKGANAIAHFTYDLDSLSYMSADVVEADLGVSTVKTQDSLGRDAEVPVRTQATITAVQKGDLKPGQTITLLDLNLFRLASYQNMSDDAKPLPRGSHVVLFLIPAPANTPGPLLPSRTFQIAHNGVVLTDAQYAVGFAVSNDMDLFGTQTPSRKQITVADFQAALAKSLAYAQSVTALLKTTPTKQNAPVLAALLRSRHQSRPLLFGWADDFIAQEICRRLASTDDAPLLTDLLLETSYGRSGENAYLEDGLNTPAGQAYLLAQITDETQPVEKRLRLVGLMDDMHPIHISLAPLLDYALRAPAPKLGGALLNLVCSRVVFFGKNNNTVVGQQYQSQIAAVVPRLIAFYRRTSSEQDKYTIEKALQAVGAKAYDQLLTASGPIQSILFVFRPTVPTASTHKLSLGGYVRIPLRGVIPQVVLENIATKSQIMFPIMTPNLRVQTRYGDGAEVELGGGEITLPDDLPHGTYHAYLQFLKDGKIISRGHYAEFVY